MKVTVLIQYGGYTDSIPPGLVTDWVELTEDELNTLREYVNYLNRFGEEKYVVVVESKQIKGGMKSFLEEMVKWKIKRDKSLAEYEKKRRAREERRKKAQESEELKLLEYLKKKYKQKA